ncbi:MAG: DUF692 family protein, partial [Candidatus Rokubacteria bacterium]|nr:DUF692 family protein [Candidatus Rokubacteria bacterium]
DGELGIENLYDVPTGAYEHVCEPEFITAFAEEFDLHLVVDIGHAVVSAYNLRMPVRDYLFALPLARLREIQISRAGMTDGLARDAHECPGPEEFQLVEELLAQTDAPEVYLTVEYYRDGPALMQAYQELWARFGEGRGAREANAVAGGHA